MRCPTIIILFLLHLVSCLNHDCLRDLPDALSFIEPLSPDLKPADIVIFSGGFDCNYRPKRTFTHITEAALRRFVEFQGYHLVFLEELEYDKELWYKGVQYVVNWHKMFAMPALRRRCPDAKYYVWLDDDILIPYYETDMLNHYINMIHSHPSYEYLIANEADPYILNTGLMVMANTPMAHQIAQWTLEVGLENNGRLAKIHFHEQDSIAIIRERYGLQQVIALLEHRKGPYNMNTFARDCSHDLPGMRARLGDAFVHFLGMTSEKRVVEMSEWMGKVNRWRRMLPAECKYPLDALNINWLMYTIDYGW